MRPSRFIAVLCSLLLACLALCFAGRAAAQLVRIDEANSGDLLKVGRLFKAAAQDAFPASVNDIPKWLAQREPAESVSLLGGDYWLYVELRNTGTLAEWVFDANNTLIEHLDARLYGETGRIQTVQTGYHSRHQFMLHYGQHVYLEPGAAKQLLIRFSSPYYRSFPRFEFVPVEEYRYRVLIENLVIIGCLGTLLSLSIFYTFAAFSMRERAQLWYAIYLFVYGLGWAFVFHVPAEMMGFRDLRWHYVPFFLLPILNTLFYRDFLRLRGNFPRLHKASQINLILPALLMPSCFLALPYAHSLATIVITIWLSLALTSGIVAWRSGFRPARYFVMAFIALMIPGMIILPANLGLLPQLVRNAELLTLVGGTLDGLLLAFALADRVKLLSEQKDAYLAQMNEALALAHTDALTGIGNRYAFDRFLDTRFDFANKEGETQQTLVLIDLDGLKTINDQRGHTVGDELLRRFADGLRRHCAEVGEVFRLGGDEFAILSQRAHENRLDIALLEIEKDLRHGGFGDSGVSHGMARASEADTAATLMTLADERMYRHKASRKQLHAAPAA